MDSEMEGKAKVNQSITGVVTINGMEYKLIGTLDMAAKKLNVKLMGFQGRTHELDFKINTGAEYGFFVTGDVHGPVDIKMVVKKDMKKIDFVVKYNNVNYAYIKLNGDAVMQGMIPTKVDYIMKYNIMDSEMEGKAKVNYNGQAPAKTLKMSFVPKHGEDLNLDFKINTGAEYGFFVTGDVHGPVDIKMVVKKDMKKIDFVVKYNNVNYAYIKLNGDAVMQGVIPTKVD